MASVLQSPLLAILKSRRRREEEEHKVAFRGRDDKENRRENGTKGGDGGVVEKANMSSEEPKKEKNTTTTTTTTSSSSRKAFKAFVPSVKETKSSATSSTAATTAASSFGATPPDFTPRRRRLRKMGKDVLRKFQQKKDDGAGGGSSSQLQQHNTTLVQKLKYEDDIESEEEEDVKRKGEESNLDDILEGFGGLGIEEASGSPANQETAVGVTRTPRDKKERPREAEYDFEFESRIEDEDDNLIELSGGFRLALNFSLYPHQEEGIKWLWKLHRMSKGGILADDMGLGKTMQISAFLAGLFRNKLSKRALIVAPKTLLKHWIKELTKCGMGRYICEFYGGSTSARINELQTALEKGGIILTTYGMVLHNAAELRGLGKIRGIDSDDENEQVNWDYMILDEGHKIKNPKMQLSEKLKKFNTKHRIIVTGTPVQNNMQELHALMEFVCEDILGDRREFRDAFERPITNGLDKAATHREREIGKATSAKLQSIISQFILRREKDKVFKKEEKVEDGGKDDSLPTLADVRKNDLVVWLKLNKNQQKLYMLFLQTESVFKALNNTGSALAALTVLKKICDHTSLLTNNAADQISSQLKLPSSMRKDEQSQEDQLSSKIDFLLELLPDLYSKGHRTLVFSQSRQMLDCIQEAVEGINLDFCRIDGSISSIEKRQQEVDRFKADGSIPLFLLTTGVGGLGLNLTEADRVVIVDPAWNPSVDNQSVDRVYRIGQTKNVVIYRLITCGTVEEKIYRKQVFKKGLSIVSNGGEEAFRYFTKQELRDLFSASYEGFQNSKTHEELQKMHGGERKSDKELDEHISSLHQLKDCFGTSDHDLLFTKAPEESTFHVEQHRRRMGNAVVLGAPKFSGGNVPQSPLARKMQIRSQWEGAGILSHLTLDDKPPSIVTPSLSHIAAEGQASSKTVARIDSVEINKVTANDEREVAMKEIQILRDKISRLESMLSNDSMVSRLPDGGKKLKEKKEEAQTKLNTLLSKGNFFTSPTRSYDMYMQAYLQHKEKAEDGL